MGGLHCTYVHMHVHNICMYVCISITNFVCVLFLFTLYTYVRMCIHTYIRIYVCAGVYMCIFWYTCTYIEYVHMYIV